MPIIEINDLSIEELIPYTVSNEIQLKRWFEPEIGIFIAESPKVIRLALDEDYEPLSMLIERKYIDGQGRDIVERVGEIPIYTADSDVLTGIMGFKLTQGILCAMRRKKLPTADEICKSVACRAKYKKVTRKIQKNLLLVKKQPLDDRSRGFSYIIVRISEISQLRALQIS